MNSASNSNRGKFVAALFAGLMLAGIATASPALAGKWDAIAVDDSIGTKGGDAGYGVGTADTKAEAEAAARHKCHSEGNSDCTVVLSYRGQCGAYASSAKHAGRGTGATERAARQAAMAECGADTCKVLVSDCVGED